MKPIIPFADNVKAEVDFTIGEADQVSDWLIGG